MADVQHNARLNQVLIDISRSPLQYASETCVRCGAETPLVNDLVRRQQVDATAIGQLLNQRGWPIDYGTFPSDYGGSHYLNLSFWLPYIRNGQQQLLLELHDAIHDCHDDSQARDVLQAVLESEQDVANQLAALKPEVALVAK